MKKLLILTLLLTVPVTYGADAELKKSASKISTNLEKSSKAVEDALKGQSEHKGFFRANLTRTTEATTWLWDCFLTIPEEEARELLALPEVNTCLEVWFDLVMKVKAIKQVVDLDIQRQHIETILKNMTKEREQLMRSLEEAQKDYVAVKAEKDKLFATLTAMATGQKPAEAVVPSASSASVSAGTPSSQSGATVFGDSQV